MTEVNVCVQVNSTLQSLAQSLENTPQGGVANGWLIGVASPSSCLVLATVPNSRTENIQTAVNSIFKPDLGEQHPRHVDLKLELHGC